MVLTTCICFVRYRSGNFHIPHGGCSAVLQKVHRYLIILTIKIGAKQVLLKMHCKKWLAVFSSPVGMSLTKLSLAVIKLFPARESLVSYIPARDRKTANLILIVYQYNIILYHTCRMKRVLQNPKKKN
jgi:hypothetical protein